MAQQTDFVASNNVKLFIKNEDSAVGTANTAAMKRLQTTSITIPEVSVPLEYSANVSGSQVQLDNQGHHVKGTNMYTFDTVLKGTDYNIKLACAATFNDAPGHAGTNTLNNTYSFNSAKYKNDASSGNTYTMFFQNAGSDTDGDAHVLVKGCIATGFTLSSGIGSEAGELQVTINWATAYLPEVSSTSLTSTTFDAGNPKNHRNLDADDTNLFSEDIVLQNYEVSFSRTIERIHYSDTTNFNPFGYAMTGAVEVTGSLTAIRNSSIDTIIANFSNSTAGALNIAEATATNYSIAIPKVFIGDTTMDMGGSFMTQTIPFTAVGNADLSSASPMLTIKSA